MLSHILSPRARLFAVYLALLALTTRPAHADVGLVLESPSGPMGFFTDAGHASVWLSRACLASTGEIQFCEHTAGVVLTSTSYWTNPGTAAIPAELFFLGARPGRAGRDIAAWQASLAPTYPSLDPHLGQKYLGRAYRRSIRILTFQTTAEQDREVIARIQADRPDFHYNYLRRNCAVYSESILKLYFGDQIEVRHFLDFGLTTPRAVERALRRTLRHDPSSHFRTVQFPSSVLQSWRQPPRNLCESATLDPKYAVPLVLFQPEIYLGFGACYAWNRIPAALHNRESATPRLAPTGEKLEGRVAAFESLTGTLPQPTFRPALPQSTLESAVTPPSTPPSTSAISTTLPSTPTSTSPDAATPAFR